MQKLVTALATGAAVATASHSSSLSASTATTTTTSTLTAAATTTASTASIADALPNHPFAQLQVAGGGGGSRRSRSRSDSQSSIHHVSSESAIKSEGVSAQEPQQQQQQEEGKTGPVQRLWDSDRAHRFRATAGMDPGFYHRYFSIKCARTRSFKCADDDNQLTRCVRFLWQDLLFTVDSRVYEGRQGLRGSGQSSSSVTPEETGAPAAGESRIVVRDVKTGEVYSVILPALGEVVAEPVEVSHSEDVKRMREAAGPDFQRQVNDFLRAVARHATAYSKMGKANFFKLRNFILEKHRTEGKKEKTFDRKPGLYGLRLFLFSLMLAYDLQQKKSELMDMETMAAHMTRLGLLQIWRVREAPPDDGTSFVAPSEAELAYWRAVREKDRPPFLDFLALPLRFKFFPVSRSNIQVEFLPLLEYAGLTGDHFHYIEGAPGTHQPAVKVEKPSALEKALRAEEIQFYFGDDNDHDDDDKKTLLRVKYTAPKDATSSQGPH